MNIWWEGAVPAGDDDDGEDHDDDDGEDHDDGGWAHRR